MILLFIFCVLAPLNPSPELPGKSPGNQTIQLGFTANYTEQAKAFLWSEDFETKSTSIRFVILGSKVDFERVRQNWPGLIELQHQNAEMKPGLYHRLNNGEWAAGFPDIEKRILSQFDLQPEWFETLGTDRTHIQPYENSCGAAAISMLLPRLGISPEPLGVYKSLDPGPDGDPISLANIKRFCDQVNLKSDGYRGSVSQLRDLESPVILHVDGKHFVVLVKMLESGALVLDPAIGRQFWSLHHFEHRWKSRVYFQVESGVF